uniref:T9SS type B sorting domain-containing protein n=2 Tax=Roseivirga sp. TaxID=1964215 RepID=UPI004047F5FE
MRNRLIILLGLICLGFSAQGQVTTEGKEFWVGFMPNNDGPGAGQSSLEIFITSKTVANVQIFIYTDNRTIPITVNPSITHREIISIANSNPYAAISSGTAERKAIRVTSDENISVYAFNNRSRSADATVVLPLSSLGTKYYASAYYETSPISDDVGTDLSQSEILIVATVDNSNITITPSVNTLNGGQVGVPFTIQLNQGDIYMVQALGDLTGTLVESDGSADDCNSFALFGGNKWARVTGGQNCAYIDAQGTNWSGGYAADHLFEQMYPVNTWGRSYSVIPFLRRTGYVLQVTASEDNTLVTIDGNTIALNAGKYYRDVYNNAISISANKPIQVAQLAQSLSCDYTPNSFIPASAPGDPMMIMISPIEQKLNNITFNALTAQAINEYFVSIITETAFLNQLTLNGAQLSITFTPLQGNPDYSYGTAFLSKGQDYTLNSEAGFIAYVYGFGNIESFGYVAGANLENLNAELILQDEFISIVEDQACINSEINFKIEFEVPVGQEPRYDTFDWHFDDGTTASGQEVQHTYTVAGEYNITLIASKGVGSCGTSETFNKIINIQEVEAQDMIGPQSVCPDVTGIEYAVSGPSENTYEWIVSAGDGTITAGQGTATVLVDWGSPNDNASIKVVPRNALGCVGDTLTLPVKINKLLEPPIPVGPAEVCFLDFQSVSYSTPVRNGSQFIWEVEGGSFLPNPSSNTSNEVTVKWDGVGSGRLWYTESNSLVDDCDGISDVLEVTIFPEIVAVENIDNASCNGFSDGSITLALSGGKTGNYQVSWDNGQTGLTASNLVAGDYVATITDAANCAVQKTYTVTEPAVLVLTAEPIPVRCFQETNGMITFSAVGGTPNAQGLYRFNVVGAGINRTTSEAMITNLRAGTYTVTVTDNNSCVDTKEVIVTEPPLLEPIVESLINQPICPQATNGTTFIEAMGGTPEYQFYWSNNPTEDSQDGSGFSQGTYSVRIVDANGCETSLGFEVVERYPKLFIPNAFSPNNDGVNDVFKPVTDCQLQYSMQIYNKWGAIVFATEDITKGWDGRVNGNKVQDGQYSYIIFYAGSINGVSFEETRRGSLKLFR